MKKILSIPKRPKERKADDWVGEASRAKKPQKKMRRLTLDIPEDLHKAIKVKAAQGGHSMVEHLREILEKEYL